MRPKMLTELVTVAEACKALDRSPAALHNWIRDGLLAPKDTSGRAALYSLVDIVVVAKAKGASIENIAMRVPHALRPELDAALAAASGGSADDDDAVGGPDLAVEKALHERAKRLRAELVLDQMRGDLLPAETVRRVFLSVGAMIREKLLGIEVEAQTHLDDVGLTWLVEKMRSTMVRMETDAERLSAPLYEGSGDANDDEDVAE